MNNTKIFEVTIEGKKYPIVRYFEAKSMSGILSYFDKKGYDMDMIISIKETSDVDSVVIHTLY